MEMHSMQSVASQRNSSETKEPASGRVTFLVLVVVLSGKVQGVCKLSCSALKLDCRLSVVQGSYLKGQLVELREQLKTS